MLLTELATFLYQKKSNNAVSWTCYIRKALFTDKYNKKLNQMF